MSIIFFMIIWILMIIFFMVIALGILTKGFVFLQLKIFFMNQTHKLVKVSTINNCYYSIGKMIRPNVLSVPLKNKKKITVDIEEKDFIRLFGRDHITITDSGVVLSSFVDVPPEFRINVDEYENTIDEAINKPTEDSLIKKVQFFLIVGIAISCIIIIFLVLKTTPAATGGAVI